MGTEKKLVADKSQKTAQTNIPEPKTQEERNFSLWNIWVASTLLKLLLIESYHSTDFDVHRNWLAITHNLPLSKWYIESTSEWTLDYPPFFAYFEWVLSQFVPQVVKDDGCLDIVAVGQYGLPTVYFQRISVILSEVVYFLALQWFVNTSDVKEKSRSFVIASSLALSPGLLIVDHVHFQYNGMMFGILIFAIVAAKRHQYCLCGLSFAILLCFKHIFLYIALPFFVFLLRSYCLQQQWPTKLNQLTKFVKWSNLFKLGSIVIAVFTLLFAPFVYYGVTPQLLARLFPFSRGLTHAYWAPNIWAAYSFVDRILIKIYFIPFFGRAINFFAPHLSEESLALKISNSTSMTRGLVGDVEFLVLPEIKPKVTFVLTLFYQLLSVMPLLIQPTFERFLGSITLCGFASFLFGWHVHEKAIMLVIIPFSFLATVDRRLVKPFELVLSAGYVSLFPLLYESGEFFLKVLYTYVWCIIYFLSYQEVSKTPTSFSRRRFFLDRLSLIYMVGLVPMVLVLGGIELVELHFPLLKKFDFFKLVIYSVYCCVGVVSSFNGLSFIYYMDDTIWG